MCSHSLKMMENYQGDLADIVRATTAADGGVATAAEQAPVADWQFSRSSITYPSDYFGDPFTYMGGDPLTPNINTTTPVSDLFFNSNTIAGDAAAHNSRVNCGSCGGGGGVNLAHSKVVDDEVKRPSNIFSRMLQISPGAKLPATAAAVGKNPAMLVSNSGINMISPPSGSGLQISSPRNAGIKRRKSQAKKVVCIPAPAPANSRSTGEVVPSDLWAWRKYGQKPIKGSPFPRGYYRCSSSKGCSARKQVERSRTDPNMLVITYTSEHNHPWPTQRNALAGSTRSQLAKNKDSSQTEQQQQQQQQHTTTKETSSPVEDGCRAVKEEADDQDLDHHFEADFGEGLLQTYKPTLADPSNHEQDSFFADLGEIGDDPLNLFGQGFSRDGQSELDPFSFYDWATNGAAATAKGGSGGESGRKS